MILVTNCAGQMCNHFLYFARALALAIDTKRDIFVLCGRNLKLFSDFSKDALPGVRVFCFNLSPIKILDWINGSLERLMKFYRGDAEVTADAIGRMSNRWRCLPIVLWNWNLRNEKAMVKHRDEVAGFLRAKKHFHVRARQIICSLPPDAIVVGVHIRRGDYKEAFGGKYYYSDAQYLNFLKRLSESLERRVVYVAVSNESIDIDWFVSQGCPIRCVSGSPIEDVVLLSECDYIVGPVSTFSGWAAYYGDKPIYRITDIDAPIDMSNLRKLYQ